jgi:FkbM family methyltransferase
MAASPEAAEVFESAAPDASATRDLAKRVLWRVLPGSVYRRLLARSRARDFTSGRFHEPEMDLVPAAVRPGEVALDVGANHGSWTAALSAAVGGEGRVFSFEPVPATYEVLRGVIRRLSLENVEAVEKGCSDASGWAELEVPSQPSGPSDDMQAHLSSRNGGATAHAQTVRAEMVALDDQIPPTAEVTFLKADIEGAELFALRGATRLIERCRPVIVTEVDRAFLAAFGLSAAELASFLGDLGYEPLYYRAGEGRLEPAGDLGKYRHCNLVFVHPDRRERLERFLR